MPQPSLMSTAAMSPRCSTASPRVPQGRKCSEEDEWSKCWFFRVLRPGLCLAEPAEEGVGVFHRLTGAWEASRARIVDRVVRLHMAYGLRRPTLFLAVSLLDRCLACLRTWPTQAHRGVVRPRLLASTVLVLAAKFEDEAVPEFASLVESSRGEFVKLDLHMTELVMLKKLDFRLHIPMASHHLHWILEAIAASTEQRSIAEYVCEVGLESPDLPGWRPMDHAAAAVLMSNLFQGLPEWTPEFEASCGVAEDESRRGAVLRILLGLGKALYEAKEGHAVYDKFCTDGLAPQLAATIAASIVPE